MSVSVRSLRHGLTAQRRWKKTRVRTERTKNTHGVLVLVGNVRDRLQRDGGLFSTRAA